MERQLKSIAKSLKQIVALMERQIADDPLATVDRAITPPDEPVPTDLGYKDPSELPVSEWMRLRDEGKIS